MTRTYPRLLAVHDLDEGIALPDERGLVELPSYMRSSHLFMHAEGVYIAGACFHTRPSAFISLP
jgi:protein transport protein SEC24